jgi:4-hydroxybenzoate polyprenyltransferase
VTPDSTIPTATERSLVALRIAAAGGLAVAVVLVVVGFSISLFAGVLALIASPVIPLVFVITTDRIRRR